MRSTKRMWFRRIRLVVLFSMIISAGCIHHRSAQRFTPSPVDANDFRLVTWNVGYFALSSNKNLRDTDIGFIAETIRNTEAQAVVLQEMSTQSQAVKIAQELGSPWTSHTVETGHQGQVLAVLTLLPITEIIPSEAGSRQILGTSLQHPSGKSIFFTGVHSPHPARGMEDTRQSILDAHSFTMDQAADVRIFAGDLNFQFDEEDADPDNLYSHLRNTMRDSTIPLGDTYYAGFRIDHVFHYPKNLEVNLPESGMIDLPIRFAKVPGFRDHRPVVVTLDLASLPITVSYEKQL